MGVQLLRADQVWISVITLVMRVARTALLSMDGKKRAGHKVRGALRALKSFELTFGGLASLKIEVDAAPGVADSGILPEDLRDLLVAVGHRRSRSPRTPKKNPAVYIDL